MIKKISIILVFLSGTVFLNAQDTLRVMVYNLLYYGEYVFGCNSANNNPTDKDRYLRTILAHDLPDVFVVNEMSQNTGFHDRIRDSVLHKISDRVYARAVSFNLAGQNIVNMLYYNTEKLALHSQYVMQTITRDIDLYKLYYKSPDLLQGDTAFIHFIAAHLKAGSSASDQQTRRNQINNVFAWLQNNAEPGNFLFMGDLNVNSVQEQSIQLLFYNSNMQFRFYDPVNQVGNWYNNPTFSLYHTQSTRTSSNNCHAGGGLDDRYDFILASQAIMNGTQKVEYVDGSYRTMGQDGQRFGKALLDSPFNASAPFGVLEALYNNSDHLPVLMSLAVNQSPASSRMPFGKEIEFSYNNPVNEELVIYTRNLQQGTLFQVDVYSMIGVHHTSLSDSVSTQPVRIDLSRLPKGFYLVEFKVQNYSKVFKVVKI